VARLRRGAAVRIKAPQDFGAGALFVVIGLGGLIFAQDLTFGSSRNMGPGYFPTILSVLILVIGVVVALKGMTIEGPSIEELRLRPLLVLITAMLVFGLLIKTAGLAVTGVLITILAAYAQAGVRIRETVVFALVLTTFITVVFVYALGQPLPVWWGN
jgi:hypothetical protein